jgi:hypothetical protein
MVNVDACCGAKRVHAKKLRVERQGLNADEHHSHSHGHFMGLNLQSVAFICYWYFLTPTCLLGRYSMPIRIMNANAA